MSLNTIVCPAATCVEKRARDDDAPAELLRAESVSELAQVATKSPTGAVPPVVDALAAPLRRRVLRRMPVTRFDADRRKAAIREFDRVLVADGIDLPTVADIVHAFAFMIGDMRDRLHKVDTAVIEAVDNHPVAHRLVMDEAAAYYEVTPWCTCPHC